MAGFFGMFDYTKEGPGVEKSERRKKGFFAFFEIFFRNLGGFMKIGALYSVLSIPLVTNGLAKVGITHIARSTTREKHSFLFADFFDTIKANWKQALILGVINLFLNVVLVVDIWFFWNYLMNSSEALFAIIGLGVALFALIVTVFMKYYIWTMVITFDLPIRKLIKNSFHFVFLNLGRNIFISVVLGVIYFGLYILYSINGFFAIIAMFLFLCVLPGFKASLIQANTFPAIKKYILDPYYAEHKGEDIEKRRALGLEIPEDELPLEEGKDNEAIFNDSISE